MIRRPVLALGLALALAPVVSAQAPEAVSSGSPKPAAAPAANGAAVRVLYPVAGSIVTTDPLLILVLGPDAPAPPAFTLDGKPLAADKFTFGAAWKDIPEKVVVPAGSDNLPLRSPLLKDKSGKAVWAAVVSLPGGEHAVALDGATLAAFTSRAAEADDAKNWTKPVLRVHNPPKNRAEALDCAKCHEADAGGNKRVLGTVTVPKSCNACHEEVDLRLAHQHVMDFLEKCHICHDPHAGVNPRQLIDTRKKVCTLCHEEGHAK
jgi:predicted CXXCH cytochrome family protein